ncbi:hypothetical protein [Trinickia terrae]|uniref:hypothetical protein n=1 Tax=Trinickia terrae TaxID=2571161 RepID=UPI00197D376C|nr:hypothetical protein [Trinickia terrae]
MDFPIIDASTQSVLQFETAYSRAQAVRYVAWYRVVRPALVLGVWLVSAWYVNWCLAHASPEELSLDAFMPSLFGIAAIAWTLTLWTLFRRLERRLNPVRQERVPDVAPSAAVFDPQLAADAGRRMVAYHDDEGFISHVMSMSAAPSGAKHAGVAAGSGEHSARGGPFSRATPGAGSVIIPLRGRKASCAES